MMSKLRRVQRPLSRILAQVLFRPKPIKFVLVLASQTGIPAVRGREGITNEAYLSSGSSLLLVVGVLVQLIGLLLLVDLVEAVDLEELEVLQLWHLGQPGTARPATQQEKTQSRPALLCGSTTGGF